VPPAFHHEDISRSVFTFADFELENTSYLGVDLHFYRLTDYRSVVYSSKLLVTNSGLKYRFGLCAPSGEIAVVAQGFV
jgi:hypothetical protein